MMRSRESAHPPTGPHPGVLTAISLGLLLAGLAATAILTGGAFVPSPLGPSAQVIAFYAEHRDAVRIAALLMLASAVPLGVATATFHARQGRLGSGCPDRPSVWSAGSRPACCWSSLPA